MIDLVAELIIVSMRSNRILIGFLFIRSIRVDEVYKAPAPVSIKARHFMP